MQPAPYLLAAALYFLTVLLLVRSAPLVTLGFAAIIFAADVAFLFWLGGKPWGLLSFVLLGMSSLLTPRVRVLPRRHRRKRRRVAPAEFSALEDRFHILEKLGTGGMASVFRAEDKQSGRLVALKVPHEKYAQEKRFTSRLSREAAVLSRLRHPNIVRVYEYGKADDTHFIAMELVDGPSLDQLLQERRLSPKMATQIILPVAEALKYIHSQGFTHRDLKPSNIMIYRRYIGDDEIDPRGVRLMDFGIAAGEEFTRITMDGARVGTPTYMSPEQAKGEEASPKSDVYSLGVVFYEALVGEAPFQGDFEQVARKQIHEKPVPPIQRNPDIPRELNDLVVRMLEKDPKKRPDLDEVIRVLKSVDFEKGRRVLPPGGLVAVAVRTKEKSIRLVDKAGYPVRAFGGKSPTDIATDPYGYVWAVRFAFEGGEGMLKRYSPEGELVLEVGRYGPKLGEFLNPVAVAASKDGDVFVLDDKSLHITRFDLGGRAIGRFGENEGLSEPQLLAAWEEVYVLDIEARAVFRFSKEGQYKGALRLGRSKGDPKPRPIRGLGTDAAGRLLIYDPVARAVRVIENHRRQVAAFPLPLADDEDEGALVKLGGDGKGNFYALRQGSRRFYRLSNKGAEAVEIGLLVKSLSPWEPLAAVGVE